MPFPLQLAGSYDTRRSPPARGFAGSFISSESFASPRSSLGYRHDGRSTMKWTLVRYRVKPGQADENERLSAAVFKELQQKSPEGLGYAVFRLPDGTFV